MGSVWTNFFYCCSCCLLWGFRSSHVQSPLVCTGAQNGEKEVDKLSTGLRSSFTFYFIWCVRMCACMCVAHVCAGDAWWPRCVSMLLKKSEASLCCFSGRLPYLIRQSLSLGLGLVGEARPAVPRAPGLSCLHSLALRL